MKVLKHKSFITTQQMEDFVNSTILVHPYNTVVGVTYEPTVLPSFVKPHKVWWTEYTEDGGV